MLDFGINRSVDFGKIELDQLIIKLQKIDDFEYKINDNVLIGNFKSEILSFKMPYSKALTFKFNLDDEKTNQLEISLNFFGKYILLVYLIGSMLILAFLLVVFFSPTNTELSNYLGIGITASGFFFSFLFLKKGINSEAKVLQNRLMTCR
jgi:hypothetical protein